jgi:glycosyltransferase involved in cell wall biosynthesis
MKVINILFSNKKGGMEQAFVDYTEALIKQKNEVAVIAKHDMLSIYLQSLKKLGVKIYKVKNKFGYWDYPLIFKIRKILKKERAEILMAHSGRAISISRKACKNLCPIIGINHSDNIKRSLKCNAIFVINNETRERILNLGERFKQQVFLLPNMVRIPKQIPAQKKEKKVLVIGAIGRFVEAKGFAELIKAAKILESKGLNFELKIAGSGEQEKELRELVNKLNLEKRVEFLGWINNPSADFFNKIDIFCLPSHSEPFGIVLLQAMLHKKAIVTTNCAGPNDIFENGKDAIIVSKDTLEILPQTLVIGLQKLLKNKKLRNALAKSGYEKVITKYSMKAIGKRLNQILAEIVENQKVKI